MKGTAYIDDTWSVYVTTSQFSTGAQLDSTGNPLYRIYEDNTDTPILTGNFTHLNNSGTTGLYAVEITLSAANGFNEDTCYLVYATATVDGVAAHVKADEFVVRARPLTSATAVASAVWDTLLSSYSTTAATATNMGNALWLLLKNVTNRFVKTQSLTQLRADDGTTPIMNQAYSVTETGFDRSKAT